MNECPYNCVECESALPVNKSTSLCTAEYEHLSCPFRSKRGFTLTELLVVVGIIAILTAIAVPMFLGAITSAKEGVDAANLRTAKSVGTVSFLTEEVEAGTYLYDGGSSLVDPSTSMKGYGQVDPDTVIQVVVSSTGTATCTWVAETDTSD